MGYAEGGQTLEYVLEYARKLHGLPGGITPAEIWKAYTQIIMRGEPIQQFDGVEKPEKVDHTAAPEPGAKNDPDDPRKRAPAGPGARERAPEPRRTAAPASASASSFAPSRARHSRARRVGAGRYRDAPTRASAALR